MAFRFRLQPLLDQKISAREDADALVLEKTRELAGYEEQLKEMRRREAELAALRTWLRNELASAPGASGEQLQRRRWHITAAGEDLEAAKEETLSQHALVEEAREHLHTARAGAAECKRQEDILTKYKEKQERRFHREREYKEALELDEVGNMLYVTRKARQ